MEILEGLHQEAAQPDASVSQPENMKVLDDLAKRTGLTFSFDETVQAEGLYNPTARTITFGQGATLRDAVLNVTKHELAHFAEGTPDYTAYSDFVLLSEFGQDDAALQAAVQGKMDAYEAQGVTLTEDSARAELVADLTRDVVLRDDASLVKLARENTTVAQRLKIWIQDALAKLKSYALRGEAARLQRQLLHAQKLLGRAIDTVSGMQQRGQGMQFSIQTMADGSQYVHVDVDQGRFEGLTPRELAKEARRVILDKFRGKTIGEASNTARVSGRTADKYAYGNKPNESEWFSAKMHASTELDNLISASTFVNHAADTGKHQEATGGWDYYKTTFEVGGELYEGIVHIMNTDSGRLFYRSESCAFQRKIRQRSSNQRGYSA